MSITLEKRKGWYWLDEMAVGGKNAPGYVRPTSITLEKNSSTDSRRMVVTYIYQLSNDVNPPLTETTAKRFVDDDGDNRFVVFIPEEVRNLAEVEGFLTTQLKSLFAKGGLGIAPTTKLLEALDKGKTRMRNVYPIEFKESPTGYLTIWNMSHTENYTFTNEGRLEVDWSGTAFRCGWGVLGMQPEQYYLYPDNVKYYHAHQYKSWPSMLQDIHRVSIDDGFVYQADQYRRNFS